MSCVGRSIVGHWIGFDLREQFAADHDISPSNKTIFSYEIFLLFKISEIFEVLKLCGTPWTSM